MRLASDRDDPGEIHASDIGGCEYATWLRLQGTPRLPYNAQSIGNFERGLAYEAPFFDSIAIYAKKLGFEAKQSDKIGTDIIGHPDIVLYRGDEAVAVIDPTTTASRTCEWRFGHAVKTAYYAIELGVDVFCEWVHRFEFIGKKGEPRSYAIVESQEHWFSLDDMPMLATLPFGLTRASTWREIVTAGRERILTLRDVEPPKRPPFDPLSGQPEEWRCRSYCEAQCSRNQRHEDPIQ